MEALKRVGKLLSPDAKKAEDGRDMFSSRAQFILCAMGGAVGLGNMLRFPSIVFNNYGLQFFIPYFIAIIFVGLPVLLLEICLGTAYRGGCVYSWHSLNKRAKGVGFCVVFNGFTVATYYVPLLAWGMKFFRHSFTSPLPWKETGAGAFFEETIVANVAPIPGELNSDGSVARYTEWPGTALIGETVGWAMFVWFVTWLSWFRGVGHTGRIIYVTMALPLVLIVILIGRACSLPNAIVGIRYYMATWRGDTLAGGKIWSDAFGQVFFSIGVGFGYFTSWASYCSQHSNAVQDVLIVACCNSLIEISCAFAVFGIVGFLGMDPDKDGPLSTFSSGFVTYPSALAEMPASNFFSALFFATLFLLGLTCVFSLLEGCATLILDTDWGKRFSRIQVTTTLIVFSALLSLMYCTEFGLQLLDSVDTFVNNLSLFFVVWCELWSATTLYRCRDVTSQIGWKSFLTFNIGFVLAQFIGLILGHTVHPGVGGGVGIGIFVISAVVAVFLAQTPMYVAPAFWGRSNMLSKFWWMAFYSGNQLTRDFNVVIGVGKNWSVPVAWAPIVKYVSCPILSLVLSLVAPTVKKNLADPIFIYGLSVMLLVVPICIAGFMFPSWFNYIIPHELVLNQDYPVAPMQISHVTRDRGHQTQSVEDGAVVEEPIVMGDEKKVNDY